MEKRHNILSELVEDIHKQKTGNTSPNASNPIENSNTSQPNTMVEKNSENQNLPNKNNQPENSKPIPQGNRKSNHTTNPENIANVSHDQETQKPVGKEDQNDPNLSEKPKKTSETIKNKKTSQIKNESKLTGTRPASWNVRENEAWKRYSPSARVSIFSSNNEKTNENNANNKDINQMKKVVTILILVGALGLILYFWSPWNSGLSYNATIVMSNQSFREGKGEILTEFSSGSEIYYKINHKKDAFNSTIMVFEIYKVNAEQKEILFKTATEEDIDSKSSVFTYLLRPDFFTETGKYRIKVYLLAQNERKLITVKDVTIK